MYKELAQDVAVEGCRSVAPLESAHRQSGALSLCPVRYELRLVEEAVVRAVRRLPDVDQQLFHREREAAYDADQDGREAFFARVHRAWFLNLGLQRSMEQALAEADALRRHTTVCRVAWAASRKNEGADLFDQYERSSDDRSVIVLVRLRAETLLDAGSLLRFLRHEFQHLVDMLDPSFGYQKQLPTSDAGPSYDSVLRNRYRVVWDTVIDGRLSRRGHAEAADVRQLRSREFRSTFPMLGGGVDDEFTRWFDDDHPTHQRLVSFVMDPAPENDDAHGCLAGRCPICRFPTAVLEPDPERLTEGARRELMADHPWWNLRYGLCSQCADLYLARHSAD